MSNVAAQLALKGDLTFQSLEQTGVPTLTWPQGTPDVLELNFEQVTQTDSAGLACLLELTRQAKQHNIKLKFIHVPSTLISLANIYGITPLLDLSPRSQEV